MITGYDGPDADHHVEPSFNPILDLHRVPHASAMLTALKATGVHVTLHHLLRGTFTFYNSN